MVATGVVVMPGEDEAAVPPTDSCSGPGTGGLSVCGRPVKAKGLCQSHYLQDAAGAQLQPLAPRRAFVRGGVIRRYGLRWPDPERLQQIEDLAIAEGRSVEDLVVQLVGERLDDLVAQSPGGKRRS